jgi:hypothetical protein
VVEDVRLVDGGGATILAASPDVVPIKIIDRVIVSEVRSRPLSLDEIRSRGILVDEDDFTALRTAIRRFPSVRCGFRPSPRATPRPCASS